MDYANETRAFKEIIIVSITRNFHALDDLSLNYVSKQ